MAPEVEEKVSAARLLPFFLEVGKRILEAKGRERSRQPKQLRHSTKERPQALYKGNRGCASYRRDVLYPTRKWT